MRRSRFRPPDPPELISRPVPDLTAFLARLDARLDEIDDRLRQVEERGWPVRARFASPDELAREYGINDQTMRGWLFARAKNGLDALIVTQGRRLYLDRNEFARWFEQGKGSRKSR